LFAPCPTGNYDTVKSILLKLAFPIITIQILALRRPALGLAIQQIFMLAFAILYL